MVVKFDTVFARELEDVRLRRYVQQLAERTPPLEAGLHESRMFMGDFYELSDDEIHAKVKERLMDTIGRDLPAMDQEESEEDLSAVVSEKFGITEEPGAFLQDLMSWAVTMVPFVRSIRTVRKSTGSESRIRMAELVDATLKKETEYLPGLSDFKISPPLQGADSNVDDNGNDDANGDETPKDLNDALKFVASENQDAVWLDSIKRTEEGADNARARHPGLIGMALSGGGIRSATFNLGVIQALIKYGVFNKIDYLSTVSGGGYLGSCISSLAAGNIQNPAFSPISLDYAFAHNQGQQEARPIRHLRDYANYLAPRGFFDLLLGPVLLIRGILINFAIVLPYIVLAAVLTILANPSLDALNEPTLVTRIPPLAAFGETFVVTKMLFIIIVVVLFLSPPMLMFLQYFNYFGKPEWSSRDNSGKIYRVALVALAMIAFIELQPHAIGVFAGSPSEGAAMWLSAIVRGNENLMTGGGAALSFLIAYFSSRGVQTSRKWSARIGPWLAAMFGFLAFWLIYLSLCRWALQASAPTIYWLVVTFMPDRLWLSLLDQVPSDMLPQTGFALFLYVFWALILFLYSFLFVDINHTSLHNFYRDRLSKAYLFNWNRVAARNGVIHNDEQLLSRLGVIRAPYHLINAALNVRQQKEAFRRGRNADFFIFSRNFVGSELTDYCRTEDMENTRRHVNLGTAMAISGAVAGAVMGKATIRPLSFLLAMLNVRLNYWLPNPMHVRQLSAKWGLGNPMKRVGPPYLFWEMLGRLRADSWNVNLSDGGHIENLGVFELLRRECRVIIVGDAERDPKLRFQGVSELARLAQIDLGVELEIFGLDNIRNGIQHHAFGYIRYPNGNRGLLVYLKSSLLRDDSLEAALPEDFHRTSDFRSDDRSYDSNAYIAYYKATHPDFPHESTADQFFDETQFECYRALGFIVAKSVFA